jgi:hypothetical protein
MSDTTSFDSTGESLAAFTRRLKEAEETTQDIYKLFELIGSKSINNSIKQLETQKEILERQAQALKDCGYEQRYINYLFDAANELNQKDLLIQKEKLGIQKKIEGLYTDATEHSGEAFRNGAKLVKVFNNLKNPAYAFAQIVELTAERFFELDKAAEDFRNTSGLLAGQTTEIDANVKSLSRDFAQYGLDVKEAYTSAQALTTVFGDKFMASNEENVKFVGLMKTNLGISEENSAGLMQNFMGLGGLTAQASQDMALGAVSLAKAANVPINVVMGQVAKASGNTLTMVRGSVKELIKGTVEAMRLGTTLENVANSGRQMLNFQESISNEMEASVLFGKNINIQHARELAYKGDTVGLMNEQNRILQSMGDISKMDVFQQDALAKSLGISTDEMFKRAAKQEELNELQSKDPELFRKYNEATTALEEQKKSTVDKYKQELLNQQVQSQQTKLANSFKQILVSISDVLTPIVKLLMIVLNVLTFILHPVKIFLGFLSFLLEKSEKLITSFEEINKIWESLSSTVSEFFSTDFEKSSPFGMGVKVVEGIIGAVILLFLVFKKNIITSMLTPFKTAWSAMTGLVKKGLFGKKDSVLPPAPSATPDAAETLGTKLKGKTGEMGAGIKEFLSNVAAGIKSFSPLGEILKGLIGIAASGPAFLLFATALPGLLVAMLAGAGGNLIKKGFESIAEGVRFMDISKIYKGIAGIAALGFAFIPLANGLKKLTGVSPVAILASIAALYALGAAAIFLGGTFSSGIGAGLFLAGLAGIVALGFAMKPFGEAAKLAGDGMNNFGAGVTSIAANITSLSSLKDVLEVFKDDSIVKGIDSMTEALTKLNDQLTKTAIASPNFGDVNATVNAKGGIGSTNRDLADKMDELIVLMKSGGIAVNIDGNRASYLLAKNTRERGGLGATA